MAVSFFFLLLFSCYWIFVFIFSVKRNFVPYFYFFILFANSVSLQVLLWLWFKLFSFRKIKKKSTQNGKVGFTSPSYCGRGGGVVLKFDTLLLERRWTAWRRVIMKHSSKPTSNRKSKVVWLSPHINRSTKFRMIEATTTTTTTTRRRWRRTLAKRNLIRHLKLAVLSRTHGPQEAIQCSPRTNNQYIRV